MWSKVDYIVIRCGSMFMQEMTDDGSGHLFELDIFTNYLQEIEDKTEYKHWFFVHYYMD